MTGVFRRYRYVSPESFKSQIGVPSEPIKTLDELQNAIDVLKLWVNGEESTATYVIDHQGYLRLAHRRSEHVSCAGGEDVLSAGEIKLSSTDEVIVVEWITNQSAGYCPEPESWPAVAQALSRISVVVPSQFSMALLFRRCDECGQINVVKDEHFICNVCSATLPDHWNF